MNLLAHFAARRLLGVASVMLLLWRTEARGYSADATVFPKGGRTPSRSRHSGVVVTSFALTF